jgi:phosphoribosylformylglycinamidine synthase
MSEFKHFFGKKALSDFRQERLLAKIKHLIPTIQAISAQKIYFVQLAQSLSPEQEDKLTSILQTKPQEELKKEHCISIPRLGTQSSWSSNVLNIFHHCGLKEIEAIAQGIFYNLTCSENENILSLYSLLHDSLTESVINNPEEAKVFFECTPPKETRWITILEEGITALEKINQDLKLALNTNEINYLYNHFIQIKRNPSDAEVMAFAQTNSEQSRHNIFNAHWRINSKKNTQQESTLFSMIKHTHELFAGKVLSAYADNAAVIAGEYNNTYFFPDNKTSIYQYNPGTYDIVLKVETHNHFAAIAPYFGAATNVGSEIRDEAATGRGAKSLAGLCGFTVSNLHIPPFIRPWENKLPQSPDVASPLKIIIEASLGAASFANVYGRPQIVGYFRTFANENYGYDKPICITGGMGIIAHEQIRKKTISPGAHLIVLGGPSLNVSLRENTSDLNFASVPQSNPEMQRRCQEVIDRCSQQGADNPILAIHDVGTGGLYNTLSELVRSGSIGAHIDLRAIPNADFSLSPLAILCNEAQERYVLAIEPAGLALFKTIALRECCPYALIGQAQENQTLTVTDSHFNNAPIDIPLSLLFEHKNETIKEASISSGKEQAPFDTSTYDWKEAAERVLTLPSVASKQFLITIADRSVGGLVAQEPFVGRWQVPVADVGIIAANFKTYSGSAMAMGERPISAISNPKASVRLAITEALLNITAAPIQKLYDVKLSANWMAACGDLTQDSALYEGVYEAGINFCANLNLCIPVGKDSLSMRTVWEKDQQKQERISPMSLVVSAFAPVEDIRKKLTPELSLSTPDTRLILIDLGHKKNRLGGSALAQVYQNTTGESADIDNYADVKGLFTLIQTLNHEGKILAYHDRSDGGLFSCICEMSFASHTGITVQLENLGEDTKAALFNEEAGVVIQIRAEDRDHIFDLAKEHELTECVHIIGRINEQDHITFRVKNHVVLSEERHTWQKLWQKTSSYIQALRDNPDCAKQEWEMLSDKDTPGLGANLSFAHFPPPIPQHLPKIAIVREQGSNGQSEMAAAFEAAGFRAVDVHMSDITEKRIMLDSFSGLVACGGFSYGDSLGAGRGWASTILHNPYTLSQFQTFFARSDTFALGVSNGCQMLVQLKDIIPGAEHWPVFTKNVSEQFESRLSLVQVENSPSWLFERMKGSQLPIIVAHGEGRAVWENQTSQDQASPIITLRYIDHYGSVTEHYPENPNGSPQGCAGLTSKDGRFNVMMPHPERVFRNIQLSWRPEDWQEEYSPWMEMFMSIRRKY